MLKIYNLHAQIDSKPFGMAFSLSASVGELHAIMRPDGTGKSTLGAVAGRR